MTLGTAVPSFAGGLRCDSASVGIQGDIQTRYIRMGRSDFHGQLDIFFYENRKITSVLRIPVASGSLQDDQGIFVNRGRDEQGREVTMNITSDEPSTLEIDGKTIHFTPHCEI